MTYIADARQDPPRAEVGRQDRLRSYDRTSRIGKLDKAWDEATAKGWTVVSMKDGWNTIFQK